MEVIFLTITGILITIITMYASPKMKIYVGSCTPDKKEFISNIIYSSALKCFQPRTHNTSKKIPKKYYYDTFINEMKSSSVIVSFILFNKDYLKNRISKYIYYNLNYVVFPLLMISLMLFIPNQVLNDFINLIKYLQTAVILIAIIMIIVAHMIIVSMQQ